MEVHKHLAEPWRITLIDTGDGTMTGGRLRRVKDYLDNEPFCITYGDGVADIDVSVLLRFHGAQRLEATMTAL